jgi:hypothetical protein
MNWTRRFSGIEIAGGSSSFSHAARCSARILSYADPGFVARSSGILDSLNRG